MPTSPDDLIALLGSALDQAGELIAATTPEQAGRPTPCRSFDLRALVNHTVHDVKQFKAGLYLNGRQIVAGDVDVYVTLAEPGELETAVEEARGRSQTAFGIGTNLTNDLGYEALQIVIKMTRCNGQPVAKISDEPSKAMDYDPSYVAYLREVFQVPVPKIEEPA